MKTQTQIFNCLLSEHYDLLELASVLSVLSRAGQSYNFRAFRVQLLAASSSVRSDCQTSLGPVLPLSKYAPGVLFIPGSQALKGLRAAPEELELVRQVVAAAPAAVLCSSSGALMLGLAGLLKERHVAASGKIALLVREVEPLASVSAVPVETSGNLISCADAGNCVEGALRVVSRVFGASFARKTAAELGVPEPLTF